MKKPPGVGKKQRRWFVLVDGELRYFVTETKGGDGDDQRGAVQINPGTTLSVNGFTLSIVNPDRTWVLEASSPDEAVR
jgi:hypothetical protein